MPKPRQGGPKGQTNEQQMLRGKLYLDRINFNSHKTLAKILVNISLNSDFC
jgi:hypothetical protein